MRSFIPSLRAVLLISFLLLLVQVPVSHAETVEEIKAQIESHNSKINAIEKEIAAYQKQLSVLGTQNKTLTTAIKSIDVTRQQTTSQIAATANRISASNLKLNRLSYEIADKEDIIRLDREVIARSFRDIQASSDMTIIEQLLSSDSLSDAWILVDATTDLSRALQEHTESLGAAKAQLTVQHQSVANTKETLSSLNEKLKNQKKALDVVKLEKARLLSLTKNQESAYQKLIAQKRAEEASFEAALFDLASKLQYAADPTRIPPAGKGVLRWPLDKVVVTQLFGKTADSGRLYSSGTHDGVDFSAAVGTPVHAALAGTVFEINQGAVPNCQYGKWVLIKHANGLATLYAHLSSIGVSRGQAVATGQVIGNAGATGYAIGSHLHFTVYDATAVTLKQYTCRSGPTVTIPIASPKAYLNPMLYL
jgi:murein DD-endopeptidase MepM/ murein hydrolase activator NlpD